MKLALYIKLTELIIPCYFNRIVMMPATENEKVFHSDTVTLSEGEMWGTHVHANGFVDENGRLEIKFIIYYLSI